MSKTFLSINFGCRVNSAETNQWSQFLINQGFLPTKNNPDLILVNTCAVTKKGDVESIGKIKSLSQKYPQSKIIATGCANLEKIKDLSNITVYSNLQKEALLKNLQSSYTHQIQDKFSHTNRFLLKIQSGCTQFCSYCIVPFRRPKTWSLEIDQALNTIDQAIKDGYQEIIVTGVNLDQFQPKLSDLIEAILEKTNIPLISFGSLPINSIDQKFIGLFNRYPHRLSHFLHIPIQSGSDKILKLMNRPYTVKKIINTFNKLKKISFFSNGETPQSGERDLSFGTDIIVGFPTETDQDFQQTIKLCQQIGFTKIHTFKYSPRPGTKARLIFENSPKISKEILKDRSKQIRKLISQKTLPSHQTPEN